VTIEPPCACCSEPIPAGAEHELFPFLCEQCGKLVVEHEEGGHEPGTDDACLACLEAECDCEECTAWRDEDDDDARGYFVTIKPNPVYL
jgi:hypothetical protein